MMSDDLLRKSRTFGQNLEALRSQRGWARAELAARVASGGIVRERDIQRWEEASDLETNPSLVLMCRLAVALGVPVTDLLGDLRSAAVDG
jgi:transcriptional regulator with XRE-family HTH domain